MILTMMANRRQEVAMAELAQHTFDRVAPVYEQAAALEAEVADRLLERVDSVRQPPACIIDLGCGTGRDARRLKRRFPRAEVIALDCSMMMARAAAGQRRILRAPLAPPLRAVQADVGQLPLPDHCVDLIYSNLSLQWHTDLDALFAEWRRVLRPDGLLLFSTLGPATLLDLRQALQRDEDRVARFADLQTIGDRLLAAGFGQPVADSESIDLTYRTARRMVSELDQNGALALLAGEEEEADSILGDWEAARGPGPCRLTYEVIFGVAFGPRDGQPRKTPAGDVATFSVESLRNSAREQ